MTESEQLKRNKYRFIIYHGHIHIISTNEYFGDCIDSNEMQNQDLKDLFTK